MLLSLMLLMRKRANNVRIDIVIIYLTKIINHFKDLYSCQYYFLLMKNKNVFLKTYNK